MVYLYVGIFMLLVTGFVATVLVLARLISPGRRSSTKAQNYETGEMTVTDPWRPFPVRYYVFALLFLVFDVEAAFLYPWAVIYKSLGLYGFRGDDHFRRDPGGRPRLRLEEGGP